MTSTTSYDIAIPLSIQIQQEIAPFIQPYLKTLSKLEKILCKLQKEGSIELFCKGGIVNYLLFPAQPRPRDFDLFIRINSSYVLGLGERIKLAWMHVFRSEESSPLERQSSELADFLLSVHQCGHFEIPSPPESNLLPLDVTIAAINLDELKPDSTSSADAMEIPIEINVEGSDFSASLRLSPYARYIGYQLSSVFDLTSNNLFVVMSTHAQSTRNGLFAYAYKLTQGKRYANQNQVEIESIYSHNLCSPKKRAKSLEEEIRKYMKNHFSSSGSGRSALFFLLNMSDIILRSTIHRADKRKVMQVINSIITSSYEKAVSMGLLSQEQLNGFKEKIVPFFKYYFFCECLEGSIDRSNYFLNVYYCTYPTGETLCIGAYKYLATNRGQSWQEWIYYNEACFFLQRLEEGAPFWEMKPPAPLEVVEEGKEREVVSLVPDAVLESPPLEPLEAAIVKPEQEKLEEAPIIEEVSPIEEPAPPRVIAPPRHSLESISNLNQLLQKFDALMMTVPLHKLVIAFLKLMKKGKKGAARPNDLEKKVFYLLLEMKKTNKESNICELVEAFCCTGVLLAPESSSQVVDLIIWFFERGQLGKAERLYKYVENKQDEVIDTLCRRLVQPQMELTKSKLIIKWILNAFKENQVGLLAYAKISLQDRTLQAHFINSAYPKACIEGKKFLEALSIEFMEHAPSEDRFDFYQKLEPILFNFSRDSFFHLFNHMSLASSNTKGFSACVSRGLEYLKKKGMEGVELPLAPLNKIFQMHHPTIREKWEALTLSPEERKGEAVDPSQLVPSKKKKKLKGVEKVVKSPSMPNASLQSRINAYELMKKCDITGKIESKQYYSLVFEIGKRYIDLSQNVKAFPFLKEAYQLVRKSDMANRIERQQYYSLTFEISKFYIERKQNAKALPLLLAIHKLMKKYDMQEKVEEQSYYALVLKIGQQYIVMRQYQKALAYLQESFSNQPCSEALSNLLCVLSQLKLEQEVVSIYSRYRGEGQLTVFLPWASHCYIGRAYYNLQDSSRAFLHFAIAFFKLGQVADPEIQGPILDNLRDCEYPHCHPDIMVQSLVSQVMRAIMEILLTHRNYDELSEAVQQLEAYLQND